MKIVEITGGLGNQMFQYSLMLALRNAFPDEAVKGDLLPYRAYKLHNGFELERVFGIRIDAASPEEVAKLKVAFSSYLLSRCYRRLPAFFQKRSTCNEAPEMTYDPSVLTVSGDRYFSGYWQNHEYFDAVAAEVRAAFAFPPHRDVRNRELEERLTGDPGAVAVHVRRGDYVKNPLFRGICSESYFRNALGALPEARSGYRFFVFSDDREWCRAKLLPMLNGAAATLVDWNEGPESFRDMQLMGCCRSMILANSSFSWWGAYLNRHADPVVLAPAKWLNRYPDFSPPLPRWRKVPVGQEGEIDL